MNSTDPAISPPTDVASRHDTYLGQWARRLLALYIVIRWVTLLSITSICFVTISALVGGVSRSTALQVIAGLAAAVILPLVLRSRIRRAVARRLGQRPGLGGQWFLAGCNLALVATLCLGFGDPTGRALRRRGDWFLGKTDGWFPRRYRQQMSRASRWLERFDLPPEARTLLADANRPQEPITSAPADPPPTHGTPPGGRPVAVAPTGWFHPMGGPGRVMPPNAACRFGAPRPGRRPRECGMGHCGVDLFRPTGSPVFSVRDGVVHKLERDEARGGIAGKFVQLTHKGGAVFSSYVHLRSIRGDLRVGQRVRGGAKLGTVGRTGIKRSSPHLHFAVAVKRGSGKRYIDPEPLLWFWRLPAVVDRPAGPVRIAARREPVASPGSTGARNDLTFLEPGVARPGTVPDRRPTGGGDAATTTGSGGTGGVARWY